MAVDPLAGTSKPLPPRDVLESRVRRPLQFAATLVPTDDPLSTSQQQLQLQHNEPRIRPRREIERVPGVPLAGDVPGSVNEAKDEIARLLQDVKRLNLGSTSGNAHSGARPRFTYDNQRSTTPALGSTEWLESRISALIFDADTIGSVTAGDAATLDLSGLQMRVLSDKIGELQDMTRLAKRSYVQTPAQGPSLPRTPSVALGKRQFKRYTSAPVTTSTGNTPSNLVITTNARPPATQIGATPRAVSGPAQVARTYPSTTERAHQPIVRARSGLYRELSSASSASSSSSTLPGPGANVPSVRHSGMSRHSSRGSVTALGEGDSFASTSSGATLVEEQDEEDEDAFGDSVIAGKGKMVASFPSSMDSQMHSRPSSLQRNTNSPLWHLKKAHDHYQDHQATEPSLNGTRTFTRSSSAMLPVSSNSTTSRTSILPDRETTAQPSRRRLISGKTVSFANLGIGGNTRSPSYKGPGKHDQTLPADRASEQGWSRSASGTWNPVERTTWKGASRGDVQLILSNNMLTCLPSTLFQVTNLVVLALRHNQLTELPGAINELKNLKELNKTLPPAILDLENLEQFTFVNTDLERSPNPKDVTLYASGRKLEPLIIRRPGTTPLRSMALSVLLSSRLPHSLPPILTSIDWEPSAEQRGTRNAVHGLYDAHTLASRVPCLTMVEARAMIAAARAAYRHSSSSRKHDDGIPNPAFSGAGVVSRDSTGEEADDAAANPYFSPCPNPAHGSVFTRKLYIGEPAVERIEWTRVNGADKEVPIRWKGCSVECLVFLEVPVHVSLEDDDEDGLSDTDVEEDAREVMDNDGFDADVLGGDDPF
ncbi:hypothetical protein QFC21_002323 [Naganishia friedmannii]|uniref:Uncharacterized protein n=1 Tax=Naganishia friedmannii TaxID=89922 RepID=A0ACC2VYI2_9TREE|nr:hypothetical protein QFC21_002323 [Naganishia friedmannii]